MGILPLTQEDGSRTALDHEHGLASLIPAEKDGGYGKHTIVRKLAILNRSLL